MIGSLLESLDGPNGEEAALSAQDLRQLLFDDVFLEASVNKGACRDATYKERGVRKPSIVDVSAYFDLGTS